MHKIFLHDWSCLLFWFQLVEIAFQVGLLFWITYHSSNNLFYLEYENLSLHKFSRYSSTSNDNIDWYQISNSLALIQKYCDEKTMPRATWQHQTLCHTGNTVFVTFHSQERYSVNICDSRNRQCILVSKYNLLNGLK